MEELQDANSWVNAGYEWPLQPYNEICRALSEAIFAWGQIESNLFTIYVFALGGNYRGAQAAWRSLQGFRSKLDIMDAVLAISDDPNMDKNEWSRLKERCRKKSLRRNDIAHGKLYYKHLAESLSRKYFVPTRG